MELGVSYISAHLPNHIEADMKNFKEIGCAEVLFALQENSGRFGERYLQGWQDAI